MEDARLYVEFSFYVILKCEVFHFIDSKLSSEDEVKTLLSQWGAWLRKLAEAESGRERERKKNLCLHFSYKSFPRATVSRWTKVRIHNMDPLGWKRMKWGGILKLMRCA